MPTFCRHNRFLERCPICSQTLPGRSPGTSSSTRAERSTRTSSSSDATRRRRARGDGVRVHREGRSADDGYRSELAPGLRASADASRLAQEIAFSSGRLLALATQPPGLFEQARALAATDLEHATWTCLLIVYLGPLEGTDPFAGIRIALERVPTLAAVTADGDDPRQQPDQLADQLDDIELGPRSSHDRARGSETLVAYRQWVQRGGLASVSGPLSSQQATQALAFTGDPAWSPQRRFERLFERLALPGLARMGRYDLLVTLGRLGLYELTPDSLQLAGARGLAAEDPTTLAAKRLFGIGDPLLLERRAAALAAAVSVPIEALDLALANWLSPQRASLGFPPETHDDGAFQRTIDALGL
jgi:Alpha-glutamyl/putrescinyl thymine pyrophosphorylase clade 3